MTVTTAAAASTAVKMTFEELKTPKGNLKARKALEARRKLVIHVSGIEAFVGGNAIRRTTHAAAPAAQLAGQPANQPAAQPDGTATIMALETAIVITVAIVVGVIVVVGLAVVAVVCLDGMAKGYTVRAKYRIHVAEDLFDDTLDFELIPPAPTN